MKKYNILSAFATVFLTVFLLCSAFFLTFHCNLFYNIEYEKAYNTNNTFAKENNYRIYRPNEATLNYEAFTAYFFITADSDYELPSIDMFSKDAGALHFMQLFYTIAFFSLCISFIAFIICMHFLKSRHRFHCFMYSAILTILVVLSVSCSVLISKAEPFIIIKKVLFSNKYQYIPAAPELLALLPNNFLLHECFFFLSLSIIGSFLCLIIHYRLYHKKVYQF